jgi:hypothetical protein
LVTVSQSLMIAAVPNIMGWLAISIAKVWRYVCQFISTHCFTNDNIGFDGCRCLLCTAGHFVSVHGKIAWRIWCRCHVLCGMYNKTPCLVMPWEYEYLCFLTCPTAIWKRSTDMSAFFRQSDPSLWSLFLLSEEQWKQGLVISANFGLWILCHQVPVYVAEVSPQNMRGALGAVTTVCSYPHASYLFIRQTLGLFMPTSLCNCSFYSCL